MYCKYNEVLRSIGYLRKQSDAPRSEEELSNELKELQEKAEADAKTNEKNRLEKERQRSTSGSMPPSPKPMSIDDVIITGSTAGNLYTTTLHVINSAVLKLGKLARVDVVHRGISRKTMPKDLIYKDPVSNSRGGIEFGFLSCAPHLAGRPARPALMRCLHSRPLAALDRLCGATGHVRGYLALLPMPILLTRQRA